MIESKVDPVTNAAVAGELWSRLEDSAWVLAALEHLIASGALTAEGLHAQSREDEAAARLLAAVGLATGGDRLQVASGLAELLADGSLESRRHGIISTVRQIATAAGVVTAHDADGWAGNDDATLLAQGRASALGGTMLAVYAIPLLSGLSDSFATGGNFLDVGVGVGEMAAAFCDSLPNAHVVGIDVLPRALDLARQTIAARGLAGRLEVRLQPVQELSEDAVFDLAWMPAPFLPEHAFRPGLRRVYDALRPGGWVIVGAGRLDGEELSVAVTRLKTLRSGGTPLSADDARAAVERAGFGEYAELPSPPGAPALYAARRGRNGDGPEPE